MTGVAGSGKSTLWREFYKRGLYAVGLEELEELFEMKFKGTGAVFHGYEATNVTMIKQAEWVCSVDKLRLVLEKQTSEIGYYFGVASNLAELVNLFDEIYLLGVSADNLRSRLLTRDGQDDIGGSSESRDYVLEQKQWW